MARWKKKKSEALCRLIPRELSSWLHPSSSSSSSSSLIPRERRMQTGAARERERERERQMDQLLLQCEAEDWDAMLSRAHTVRFLIVFCDCCLSHCTNMIPMSNCRISVVLMSDCTTVKTRQKRTYSRKTCPEFYVINPWPAFSRYNGS